MSRDKKANRKNQTSQGQRLPPPSADPKEQRITIDDNTAKSTQQQQQQIIIKLSEITSLKLSVIENGKSGALITENKS